MKSVRGDIYLYAQCSGYVKNYQKNLSPWSVVMGRITQAQNNGACYTLDILNCIPAGNHFILILI